VTISPEKLAGRAPEPRVPVDVRVWSGQKLALWKSKVGWDIAAKQAAEITARCRHAPECPAPADPNEPCLSECPDHEIWLSALVVLNAARAFAPPVASKIAEQPYAMPSREYVASLVAELGACQAELEVLRGTVVTMPPDSPQLTKETQ
jgi:hypothetical protein